MPTKQSSQAKQYSVVKIAGRFSQLIGYLQIIFVPIAIMLMFDSSVQSIPLISIIMVLGQIAAAYVLVTSGGSIRRAPTDDVRRRILLLIIASVVLILSSISFISLLYVALLVSLVVTYSKVKRQ